MPTKETPEMLTEYERKTLEILRDNGGRMPNASSVGFALFEGEQENCKRNPSPQGMALAAGRFLGPLSRRGLIHGGYDWSLSEKGRELLASLNECKTEIEQKESDALNAKAQKAALN